MSRAKFVFGVVVMSINGVTIGGQLAQIESVLGRCAMTLAIFSGTLLLIAMLEERQVPDAGDEVPER